MADTIAALASPPGPAERGVIRVSGPDAARLVSACARDERGQPLVPAARAVVRGELDDGRGRQPLQLVWMPAPASYTREDVAELHLCGSPPLLQAALERLIALGARPARPGEFTRRAFESGRIDLTQAEGVLALVEAENGAEARAAELLLAGGLSERVDALREGLVDLRALAEASLDFDERETGHVEVGELTLRTRRAIAVLDEMIGTRAARVPRAASPRVVLCGAPNAGKSTLFNALAGGMRALVSAEAGTTRDWLEAPFSAAGRSVRLVDVPGLDPAGSGPKGGDIDARAQHLAGPERAAADLLLWVVDAAAPAAPAAPPADIAQPAGTRALLAWNKVDRADAAPAPPEELLERLGGGQRLAGRNVDWVAVSAETGAGLAELGRRIGALLDRSGPAGASAAGDLAARHSAALGRAREHLCELLALLETGGPLDAGAELARGATDALDELSGRTTGEDVLDRIFARFCLGK